MNKFGLIPITKAIIKYLESLGYSDKQIHDFLSNAKIEIDSGWECSETGFDSVWINIEKNKICLVNDHYYRYEEDREWVEILEGKDK